jgi:alpha-beta hydrolase superfamily lysophospholipase
MSPMAIPNADVAFPSLDGTSLRGRYWAHANPRGVLLISHGLGEHGGSYRRTAEPLVEALGIDVLAFDYRGSGRSPGKRGVVRNYDDLFLDLAAANRWAAVERPGLPRFLLGHSNGGLVALSSLLDHDLGLSGVDPARVGPEGTRARSVLDRNLGLSGLIVSNPPLRVLAQPPAWKLVLGVILLRVAPKVTLPTGLTNEQLTHDPAIRAEIAADLLRHGRISPPLYFGMKAAGPIVLARAAEIRLPTLMILGGSDPIIDAEAARQFFEDLGAADKTLKVYPKMRHEPLNEIGREAVIADLVNWLEPRLKPREGEGSVGR